MVSQRTLEIVIGVGEEISEPLLLILFIRAQAVAAAGHTVGAIPRMSV